MKSYDFILSVSSYILSYDEVIPFPYSFVYSVEIAKGENYLLQPDGIFNFFRHIFVEKCNVDTEDSL